MDPKKLRKMSTPVAPPIVTPCEPQPRATPTTVDTAATRRAAQVTWDPHMDPVAVPPGYRVRGVSILRDADGRAMLSWHKTTRDADDPQETARLIGEAMASGGLQPLPVIEPPPVSNDELLAVYPLGDPHIGLYCWAAECGESFDLDIAERQYLAAAAALFPRAPLGSDALLINLGDFFHADDPTYRTSSGRNTVDVDTRYERVIMTGIRIMQSLIDTALVQHRNVHVWCLRGNHDDRSALLLREAIRGRYCNNPRVIVDATPSKFHYHEFGKNLLGAVHGDGLKGKRSRTILEVVVNDQREAWGRTKHGKVYVGHIHNSTKEEPAGLEVETYRTLAPKDAWHTATGYRSGRDIRLDLWHRDYGPRGTLIAGMDEIKAMMDIMAAQEKACE